MLTFYVLALSGFDPESFGSFVDTSTFVDTTVIGCSKVSDGSTDVYEEHLPEQAIIDMSPVTSESLFLL